jgi:hypothetical protein
MDNVEIISVNKSNIIEHPATCFLNPNNEGYKIKCDWLHKRFSDGMKIKLLYLDISKKCNGYIEYVPGENAWRAVQANGYMFIHCIWITPNKYKNKGYGSLLINECIKDAEDEGKTGVAAITSEGSFMAGSELFMKNDFKSVESAKPSFELMVKSFKEGTKPKFMDYEAQLAKYNGLNLIYSNQCPWVARAIPELRAIAKRENLDLKVTELKTAEQAQNAPSIYAVFSLVLNGKLLADHYISARRFSNIIRKEIS